MAGVGWMEVGRCMGIWVNVGGWRYCMLSGSRWVDFGSR